jgi:hypothetical protein
LWYSPTSPFVWFFVVAVFLFLLRDYYRPERKYWRVCKWLLGVAGIVAMTPTVVIGVQLPEAVIGFATTASTVIVAIFAATASFFAWLQHRSESASTTSGPSVPTSDSRVTAHATGESTNQNIISGLAAEKLNVVIGVSNENHAIVLKQNAQLIEINNQLSSRLATGTAGQDCSDDPYSRTLITDIRRARARLEMPTAESKALELETRYRKLGEHWNADLKREILITIAETEQNRIAQSENADTLKLKAILREIEDV